MRQDRGHRVGKHGVSTRKRRVDHVMLPKVSVPIPFAGSLPGRHELHRRVNQKGVDERL